MPLKLISATPSPYARINRIAMLEKGIDFELQSEIPWHSDTETPKYNPLEKLPILIFDDGRQPIYDSVHIQDYIIQKYAAQGPQLITGDIDTDLQLKQVQVLSEGVMDAVVLAFFEKAREEQKRSQSWMDRQIRKYQSGFKAFDELARNRQGDYLFANQLTIADIAVVCAVGFVDFNGALPEWREKYPELEKYFMKLDQIKSFQSTRPAMFDIKLDRVV